MSFIALLCFVSIAFKVSLEYKQPERDFPTLSYKSAVRSLGRKLVRSNMPQSLLRDSYRCLTSTAAYFDTWLLIGEIILKILRGFEDIDVASRRDILRDKSMNPAVYG